MSAPTPDLGFASYFETLDLDDRTLAADKTATIVPDSLRDFAEPIERMRTLPRLEVGHPPDVTGHRDLDVIGTLGEGGMGLVRLATQTALDREVAVKTLRTQKANGAPQLLQEAYVTGRLEHPNVVPVYTLGKDGGGLPLIIMKRIEGVEWLAVLNDPNVAPREEPADLQWHLEILVQVCNALRYAHSRKVIHRDIKPENVMIGRFGEVYLLDWGIALSITEAKHEAALLPHRDDARGIAGTPAYMAPEMTDNDAVRHEERTDIYLLGATLHHILAGAPPHDGANLFEVMRSAFSAVPPEYPASVPPPLAEAARRAMAKEPEDRYPSVEAFRTAILDFLEHRASIELGEEAQRTLEAIRSAVAVSDRSEAENLRIHDLFTECRFAARQAIREWSHNDGARATLRECSLEQTRFALGRRDLLGAQAALGELETPPDELRAAVDELAEELERERREHVRLREFEADHDLHRGTLSRSIFAMSVGLAWAATCFWAYYLQGQPGPDGYDPMIGTIRMSAIAFIAIFLFRKRLFSNIANRRITQLLIATLAVIVAFRAIRHTFIIPHEPAHALEVCIYALAAAAAGILADLRISLSAVIYLAAAAATIWWPVERTLILGFAHIAAFAWVAFLWTPRQMNKRL